MNTVEALGDLGYMYNPGADGQPAFEATALSSHYDLVPNPAFAERFAGMSDEEVHLAQRAYNTFHAPYAIFADHVNGRHPITITPEVLSMGVSEFALGFRLLRRLFGEQEYGGLEIVDSPGVEQTPDDDYLSYIGEGKLIVNHWVQRRKLHDIEQHLMGGLLADPELKKILSPYANKAHSFTDALQKEYTAGYIDLAFLGIQNLWKSPTLPQQWDVEKLTAWLIDLVATVGHIPGLNTPLDYLVAGQVEQLKVWQRERPFVLPKTLEGAGSTALVGSSN